MHDEEETPANFKYNRRIADIIRQEDFKQCPKFIEHDLSEEQVTKLINLGIEEYLRRQDEQIGKLTKKGIKYILGVIISGLLLWLNSKGFIRLI